MSLEKKYREAHRHMAEVADSLMAEFMLIGFSGAQAFELTKAVLSAPNVNAGVTLMGGMDVPDGAARH